LTRTVEDEEPSGGGQDGAPEAAHTGG